MKYRLISSFIEEMFITPHFSRVVCKERNINMMIRHSKVALLMTKIYLFIALISLLIATSGLISIPASLPVVNQNDEQTIQLEQARLIVNIAINQNPDNRFLNHFYKADWLLTSNYNELTALQKPAFDGDSFSRRIAEFNQTAQLTYKIYNDCITALLILSIGSLVLTSFTLLKPSYLASFFLMVLPIILIVILSAYDLSFDPLTETYFVIFFITGFIIYFFQLVFTFRYENPSKLESSKPFGLRRSLVFINFGMVMTLTPLIIGIGSSATSSHARLALALFGEEIMTYIVLIVGVIILLIGIVLFMKSLKKTNTL